MFARYPGIHWDMSAVCAAVLLLAAVSLAAIPAHGFGLERTWQDGMKAATDDLKALGAEGSAGNRKSPGQEGIDREIDRLAGKATGKAADKAERAMWKVGKKAWGRLEKTKKYGPLAKKLGKRWGAAARMGTRLSPHVGTALTVWDFGYAVGGKLIAPKVVSAIDRHFDEKWEKQQAELSREIADLRRRGEEQRERRERGKDVPSPIAAGIAVRMLMKDGRGPWARDTAEDSTPAADRDPWAVESPDVRYARPVAVKTAPAPDSTPAGSGKSAWDAETPAAGKDPWAAESSEVRFARPVAGKAAPAPAKDVETGPSNYEKALNSLRGGGARPAGYEGALEKLEDDRRAEQARREAEAQAERRRQAARAAEARRQQAARDAEARRAAAARERDRQRALERARRDQRDYSKRNYDNSRRQLNRSMQMLQQTRQQQQRAYQRQKALDLQRQRQRQLEQARRQRIYEQQRERDRQTYGNTQQKKCVKYTHDGRVVSTACYAAPAAPKQRCQNFNNADGSLWKRICYK